ncbi:hypothetical protein OH77DRAFT_1432236 [Trametes cingulata]|nr:hypothetical protein OH77DRAFT_1432236 [Trametes cingulata]
MVHQTKRYVAPLPSTQQPVPLALVPPPVWQNYDHDQTSVGLYSLATEPACPLQPGLPVSLYLISFPLETAASLAPTTLTQPEPGVNHPPQLIVTPLSVQGRLSEQGTLTGTVVEFTINNELATAPIRKAIVRVDTAYFPNAVAWVSFAEQLTRRLLEVESARRVDVEEEADRDRGGAAVGPPLPLGAHISDEGWMLVPAKPKRPRSI